MKTVRLSTVLKTYLISKPNNSWFRGLALVLLLFVAVVPLLAGCSAKKKAVKAPEVSTVKEAAPVTPVAILAPWELRPSSVRGSEQLSKAFELEMQGRLEAALEEYERLELAALSNWVKNETTLNKASVLLKLGRSKETLDLVSKVASERGVPFEALEPRLALIVAFSYYHRGDVNQTLAWFSLVERVTGGHGPVSSRARASTQRVLASLPEKELKNFQSKWASDSYISSMLKREQDRRSAGGEIAPALSTKWFFASTYRPREVAGGIAQMPESEFPSFASEGSQGRAGVSRVVIGALLPLTGEYAGHATNVRNGIELAVEKLKEAGTHCELVYGDTGGSDERAAAEYRRLVSQGAQTVLGPLLVSSTRRVAEEAPQANVPIVSFAKRRGIPELGPEVYRLGATAENQTKELVGYAVRNLGLESFGVLYPNTENGREFALTFRESAAEHKGFVSRLIDYEPDLEVTIEQAAREMRETGTAAVFIPDSLERVWRIAQIFQEPREGYSPYRPVLLGPALWDDSAALGGFGAAIERAVFVSPFFSGSVSPLNTSFRERYQARFAASPGLLAAQAFDATNFVVQAISAFGASPSVSDLVPALRNAPEQRGVTGALAVTPSGDIVRRMSVVEVKDGQATEVMVAGQLKDAPTVEAASLNRPL